ncbi:hypothetical protein L0664_15825 [Octadecabacter sp. G9-8]|uniref:Piwi domain-containing protein n=1 Tax=Octadecabacter dasysiphoniae TaxID=2909341 RepID=A0ABS9CZ35_9RHOB|nr:hypothetical protein [Octadecabacter dasysiphoniae]MCF2872545.1 hypothetical protein [Octadecabacter dasysiphoniae]
MDGTFDIDRWSGDFMGQHADTIAGPLSSTLRQEELIVNARGTVVLPAGSYAPLLWICPRDDLGDVTLRVEVTQTAPGRSQRLDGLKFAPYSERDGFLPYMSPTTGPGDKTLTPFQFQIVVRKGAQVIPLGQIKNHIKVRVTNGRFAKLMAFTQVETLRVRRLGREMAARRTLMGAAGNGLDRIGRELAVPRLDDKIEVKNGEMLVRQETETDAAYRRRLGIYRPFSMPTRNAVLDRLNNANSVLRQTGFKSAFDVLETDNPFMIGFKIVAVGETATAARRARLNYLAYLRDTVLIDAAANVPATRHLPKVQRTREQAMRTRLRGGLRFKSGIERSMAPWLAVAFDRLVRLADRLNITTAKWQILQAQDDGSDSRFELGLAARIKAPTAAQLRAFRTKLRSVRLPKNDPELAGVIASLKVSDNRSNDGAWLFNACGFRTFQSLRAGEILVSHASFGPLNISGPNTMTFEDSRLGKGLHARLNNNSGSAPDLALKNALAANTRNWPNNLETGSMQTQAQTSAAFNDIEPPTIDLEGLLKEVGLKGPTDFTHFGKALSSYPRHVFRILVFEDGVTDALDDQSDDAIDFLGSIADTLGSNGASSMAFVSIKGKLALVVSSIGLPQVGTNLGPRRSSDFFWNVQAVSAPNGSGRLRLAGQGTRAVLKAPKEGVYAVTCLAYSRIGKTDPFEWRITLPRDAKLTYPQYEILMNMLSRMFPVGVEINTWDIRRHNVALDGRTQQALSPRLSRSYRPFKRSRFHGTGDTPALLPRT